MFGSKAKVPSRSTQHAEKPNDQPKDALAALMEGETPDERSLRFPNEKTDSWRAGSSQSRPGARMEDYNTDYSFGSKSDASMGEYRPRQQNSALDSVRSGAANTGNFIKTKSTAGASYVKEKDWAKEKAMAGKAGTATKNGAMAVGSGVAKGAGWLWSSSKNGINKLTDPNYVKK